MASKRRQKSGKDVSDLTEMVTSGASGAYEASQLFRSRAVRLKTKNDFLGAMGVLNKGATVLLTHGHERSGYELANLLLEFIEECERELEPELMNMIQEIEQAFPEESLALKTDFLKSCVKLTSKSNGRDVNDAYFHVMLGRCQWDANDKSAIYNFVAGEAPEALCQKIVDTYGSEAKQMERERSLCLGVLHFLALENLRDANELMKFYGKAMKSRALRMDSELLTFLKQLLLTCRRDAQPLFRTLVNNYSNQLNFDPSVSSLLMGPIGQKFFGVQPKANPMMSMLQQMMA
jgi:hypothetical protein